GCVDGFKRTNLELRVVSCAASRTGAERAAPASLQLPSHFLRVPSARLGRMPRESLDAPDDLPEEVLRQASDRHKRQTAFTTMEVRRKVWASPGPMLTGGGHAPRAGQRTAFRCPPRPRR